MSLDCWRKPGVLSVERAPPCRPLCHCKNQTFCPLIIINGHFELSQVQQGLKGPVVICHQHLQPVTTCSEWACNALCVRQVGSDVFHGRHSGVLIHACVCVLSECGPSSMYVFFTPNVFVVLFSVHLVGSSYIHFNGYELVVFTFKLIFYGNVMSLCSL